MRKLIGMRGAGVALIGAGAGLWALAAWAQDSTGQLVDAVCADNGLLLKSLATAAVVVGGGKLGLLMKAPGEAGTVSRGIYHVLRVMALAVGPMVPAALAAMRQAAQAQGAKAMLLLGALATAGLLSACQGDKGDLTLAGMQTAPAGAQATAPAAPVTPVTVAATTATAASAPADAAAPAGQGGLLYRINVDLAKKAVPDLQAAIADATAHQDKISLACWSWGLPIAQSIAAGNMSPVAGLPGVPVGLFSGIQTARDIKKILQAGPGDLLPDDFYLNCGPLLAQARMSVDQFLLKLGITTAGAAVVGPAALPLLGG